MDSGKSGETVSEARKAAILLSAMETDAARQLISQLETQQRARVVAELRELDQISPDEHAQVVAEFQRLSRDPGRDDSVEWDVSERMLVDARSEPEEELNTADVPAEPSEVSADHGFAVTTDVLRALVAAERPQAAAALLSIASSEQSEVVMRELPSTRQMNVRRRLTHLTRLNPEVDNWLRTYASERIELVGEGHSSVAAEDAVERTTDFENSPEENTEEQQQMPRPTNAVSPDTVVGAADFNVLMDVEPRTIEWVLTDVAPEIWAIALMGASSGLIAVVFQSAAPELMERVRRAMNNAGPVMLRDIDRAQQFILKSVLEYEVHQPVATEQPVE